MTKLFITLASVNRSNWGAAENVTLNIADEKGERRGTLTYDYSDETVGLGTVSCQASDSDDPIMMQIYAMHALWEEFIRLADAEQIEFLADVFNHSEIIEFIL